MKEKMIIFKENSIFKITTAENYNCVIRDAHKIQSCNGFKSAQEVKEYFLRYFGNQYTANDFIIAE